MNPTPADSSHILLALVQFLRKRLKVGPGFSLANLATLLAVAENPGVLQADIEKAVGGVDSATLTRHLNMLAGLKRADSDVTVLPVVRTERNALNRRLNDVYLTPAGEKLMAELATQFNRLLTRVGPNRS